MICINEEKILNFEKKIFLFKSDKCYNYASCIANSNNMLPKININLYELNLFLKNKTINENNNKLLQEDIILTNQYYGLLTSNINTKNVKTIKEQSIIFYLFHFMNNVLFYILLNPNFSIDDRNCDIYLSFITNYLSIKEAAELYLNKKKIIESNTLLMKNNEIIDEYYEIYYYKNEFQEIVKKCHYILDNILGTIKSINQENNLLVLANNMNCMMEKFIILFNIFHSINERYNIIDYKYFYNEKISKLLNLEKEFKIYLNNEKIRFHIIQLYMDI